MLTILSALLLLVACGPNGQQASPTVESAPADSGIVPTAPPADAAGQGYPAPTVAAAPDEPYPSGAVPTAPPTFTPSSYPPAEEVFQEPRFRIDQPVSVSATTISGQSPPNTPLALLDITYNGAVLGLGRSDENGRFSIPVTGLVEGNRIGLGIGELAQGQTIEQMAEFYFPYRGEGFMNIPNLGIYFDTTLVTP
jgi:hypothetical protein